MRYFRLIFIGLLLFCYSTCFATFLAKPLSKTELTTLVSGKNIFPVYAYLMSDQGKGFNNNANLFYHSDGSIYVTFTPRYDDRIGKATGKWTVDDNGRYCEAWDTYLGMNITHCGYWYVMDNVYLVITDNERVFMMIPKQEIKKEFHFFDLL